MNYRILTNNPTMESFLERYPELSMYELNYIEISASDILLVVRAAICEGAVLVSNPLSGVRMSSQSQAEKKPTSSRRDNFNDKPLFSFKSRPVSFNPYKSMLISDPQEVVDFQSLKIIDEALEVYRKYAGLRTSRRSDDTISYFQNTDMNSLIVAISEVHVFPT